MIRLLHMASSDQSHTAVHLPIVDAPFPYQIRLMPERVPNSSTEVLNSSTEVALNSSTEAHSWDFDMEKSVTRDVVSAYRDLYMISSAYRKSQPKSHAKVFRFPRDLNKPC